RSRPVRSRALRSLVLRGLRMVEHEARRLVGHRQVAAAVEREAAGLLASEPAPVEHDGAPADDAEVDPGPGDRHAVEAADQPEADVAVAFVDPVPRPDPGTRLVALDHGGVAVAGDGIRDLERAGVHPSDDPAPDVEHDHAA